MSRILYDFVVTVYDIVEKSAISHTISGGGVPRRVLKLLYRSSVYDIVYYIVAISFFCILHTDILTTILYLVGSYHIRYRFQFTI